MFKSLVFLFVATLVYGEVKNQDPFSLGIDNLKRPLPVYLYYAPSVPKEFYPAFEAAAQSWNEALGKPVFYFNGEFKGSSSSNDDKNVIYWLNPFPGPKNYQAQTPMYWVNLQIVDTDMIVNGEIQFSTGPNGNQVDLQSVALHEFGHFLGLNHITGQPSVMNPSLENGTKRRKLYPIDLVNIKDKYP